MRPLLGFAFLAALATSARADTLETLRSYWDEGHTSILSDVRVTHADGSTEVRQVLGGSVDGIAMVQIAQWAGPGGHTVLQFVPTRDKAGARIHWNTSCIFITPDSAGSTAIPGDAEMTAIQASADAWNSATASCSYQRIMVDPPEPLEVGLDGKNIVKFREDRWCRPAIGGRPEKCYDAGATAITTLFYVDKAGRADDGVILDTDIEVNSVYFAMATGCETECQTNATHGLVEDLQNTLTHEMGHVLGLDHTCWPLTDQPAPLDDQGNPVPSCRPSSALPPAVVNATMYTYQEPMETKKRTPEQDDVDGVCTNYPIAQDPGAALCAPVEVSDPRGCCSVVGAAPRRSSRDATALLVALLLCAALVTGRACSRIRRR